MKCAKASPNVHMHISYTTGSPMWYAAYNLIMLLSAVQVPNVRADSSLTGDEFALGAGCVFSEFGPLVEELLPAYTSRVPARDM